MPGVLISDNGSHSADQWAVVTAEHIWPINPAIEKDRLMAARRIQNQIAEVLVGHFNAHIEREKTLLAEGAGRLEFAHDSTAAVNDAMTDICNILKGTPWEEKPQDPEWDRIMRGELDRQFNTAQHVERQWHCQRNQAPETDAFLAKHNLPRI